MAKIHSHAGTVTCLVLAMRVVPNRKVRWGKRVALFDCPRLCMQNPWVKIPKTAPYVLPQDYPLITDFNKTANSRQQIRLNVAPQPFLGNPKTAEVYLLNLNPGYSEKHEEAIFFTRLYRYENFKSFAIKNKLPFYLLNPKLNNTLGSI